MKNRIGFSSDRLPYLVIVLFSILIVYSLHALGALESIELKLVNFRYTIRGPIETSKEKKVILVEIDDETFRLLQNPTPYGRGTVWANTIKNLADAGAKVVAIDFVFDKPDHQTENIKSYLLQKHITDFEIFDGDDNFIQAVQYANEKGTKIVLSGKISYEPTRIPPLLIIPPTKKLEENIDQSFGVVNIDYDSDGFIRRYPIFYDVDNVSYYSLGLQSVKEYYNRSTSSEYKLIENGTVIQVYDISVKSYGKSNMMYLNYSGSISSIFETFKRYPLSNILDTKDFSIGEKTYDPEMDEWDYFEDSDWMDMYIDPNNPFYKIFSQKNPFKDKIIILGSSLSEDQDLKLTPYYSYKGVDQMMPGMEVHANAIQQILDSNYILTPLGPLEFDKRFFLVHLIIIFIITVMSLFIILKVRPLFAFTVIGFELLVWFSFSIGSFIQDYFWVFKFIPNLLFGAEFSLNIPNNGESMLIPVIFPMLSILMPYGFNLSYQLYIEGKEKKFLKNTFGTYISPELIDQMVDEKTPPLLGGSSGERSIIFTDIQSFSTFSELLTAKRLVELLNEYFTEITEIIIEEGGTLDKYEGDAMIAFFGAPIEQEDSAFLALKSAVLMQKGCARLREKWQNEGDKWPDMVSSMRTRIGVCYGDMVVGNMGSRMRMNYTAMGNTVNTAARLESGSKQYGINIATTLSTIQKAGEEKFEWRIIDKSRYVGKKEVTNTVEVLGFRDEITDDVKKMISLFNEGFENYKHMEWDKAIQLFEKSVVLESDNDDWSLNPSLVMIERCKEYKLNPPGHEEESWDGAYTLTIK